MDNKNTGQAPGQKFTVKHDSPLLEYLHEIFPEQSRTGIKAYLTNGQANVNGHKVTAFDHRLKNGDTLVILPKKLSISNEIQHAARVEVKNRGIEILYEDECIIVVNKRSGMPVVSTGKSSGKKIDIEKKGGKASLLSQRKEVTVYSLLCDYVRTKVHAERLSTGGSRKWKPSNVFIVHRIDKDTSGVVVFAKTETVQHAMQDSWNSIVTERSYTGIVEGRPFPEKGTIVSWLKENPKSMKMISSRENPEGFEREGSQHTTWQKAITHYRTIRSFKDYTLMDFNLETGRKNQIRVHCAEELHCPIAGDKKYGALSNPAGRLALHAGRLTFIHPATGKEMTFTARTPKEFFRITD